MEIQIPLGDDGRALAAAAKIAKRGDVIVLNSEAEMEDAMQLMDNSDIELRVETRRNL